MQLASFATAQLHSALTFNGLTLLSPNGLQTRPCCSHRALHRPKRYRSKVLATFDESAETSKPRVVWWDESDQLLDYGSAWSRQHALVTKLTELRRRANSSLEAGICLLVQHPPVYTLGSAATENNLLFDREASAPHPVFRVERGGEVTYHGPGQLVLYPVLDLTRFRKDLHWYLRQLEEVTIRALQQVSGIAAGREEGLTGVWIGSAKVAAIGIRVRSWITFHGLALNVTTDMRPFGSIVPCGIQNRSVTSVEEQLAKAGAEAQRSSLPSDLLGDYRKAMKSAFAKLFGAVLEDYGNRQWV